MAIVEFLGPINREKMELEVQNLRELKEALKSDKELAGWLADCAVAVNDQIVNSLDVKLGKDDRVALLPPVCGG